jgi:hypothetical protein
MNGQGSQAYETMQTITHKPTQHGLTLYSVRIPQLGMQITTARASAAIVLHSCGCALCCSKPSKSMHLPARIQVNTVLLWLRQLNLSTAWH